MKVIAIVLLLVAAATGLSSPSTFRSQTLGLRSGRIIGGVDAFEDEFPFHVALQWVFLGLTQHICSGTILRPNVIVTAGQCFTESSDLGRIDVRAGIYRLSQNTDQRFQIIRTVIHPDYSGGVDSNDIALGILGGSFTYGILVQPAVLPEIRGIALGSGILSGWGATSSSTITPNNPDVLQKIIVPIVPHAECFAIIGSATPFTDSNVCTGPLTGGVGSCTGDGGAGLIQRTANGTVLIGIVSWGFTPCASPGLPTVHTKVSHYVEWIQANLPI